MTIENKLLDHLLDDSKDRVTDASGDAAIQRVMDAASDLVDANNLPFSERCTRRLALRNVITAELQAARAAAMAESEADIKEMRGNYEGACKLVEEMHMAAMGGAIGPVLGVVEDIAALREQAAKDGADLQRVYAAFSIGERARSIDTLMINIENSRRRSDCLWKIEREFFMVSTPPDDDDDEPGEECLLNWGDGPIEYVKRFREALEARAAIAAGGAK